MKILSAILTSGLGPNPQIKLASLVKEAGRRWLDDDTLVKLCSKAKTKKSR